MNSNFKLHTALITAALTHAPRSEESVAAGGFQELAIQIPGHVETISNSTETLMNVDLRDAGATSKSSAEDLARSGTRERLWKRTTEKHSFPLNNTPLTTRITITTLGGMLNVMKNSVDIAQWLPSGRKGTLPSIGGTHVEKISIPRIKEPLMMSGKKGDVYQCKMKENMNAEWVWNGEYKEKSRERVVIYAHGGAYVLSSRRTHRSVTSRIAKYGVSRVLAIDYRLAPTHVFPGPLVDVLSAYKFVLDSGYSPEQVCFSGDSAGGGLSISAMLYCRDSILHSYTPSFPIPGCIAAMSPYLDMTQSMPAWHLNKNYCYLPQAVEDPRYFTESRSSLAVGHDRDLSHVYASPVFSSSAKDVRISKTLIQVGDAERVRDDGLYFATRSMSPEEPIQVEVYENGVHVFQLFAPFDSFSNRALERLGSFVKENCGLQDVQSTEDFERKATMIFRTSKSKEQGLEEEDIPDLKEILQDGLNLLIEDAIWEIRGDRVYPASAANNLLGEIKNPTNGCM